ncbi:MAG: MFS transporter [Candidatus Lokiarchaeota archaeon]|nr:MFS transporter [Candidatus Lokiarchaeota archaeon]MBD3199421.1 MFS transporter [Candidatus Lokiarchaeota archaeon]
MSDEILEGRDDLKGFSRFVLIQVIVIGVLWLADTFFYFFEQNIFNTYVTNVLQLDYLYVSLMVGLSAIVGLIFNFSWGIISDNTRSKYGRRRPFLLFSLIAGPGMIIAAFSNNYVLLVIFDVLLIGITANAVSIASRALIPDVVELKKRGRANGIVQAVSYIGLIFGLVIFLLFESDLGATNPTVVLNTHIIVLTLGGIVYTIAGIIGFIFIKEKPPEELPPKKPFSKELRELIDVSVLKEQNNFFRVILATSIYQTGIGCVMAFLFPLLTSSEFPFGMTDLLIAIGIGFIALILGVMFLGRLADKYGRKKFLPFVILLIGVIFFFIPFSIFTANLILFIIATPFMLIGLLGLNTVINAWAQDTLPEGKKGQFYGIFNITLTVPQIIGGIVGGLVADFIDVRYIFLAGAVFFLLSIPIFLRVKETLEVE